MMGNRSSVPSYYGSLTLTHTVRHRGLVCELWMEIHEIWMSPFLLYSGEAGVNEEHLFGSFCLHTHIQDKTRRKHANGPEPVHTRTRQPASTHAKSNLLKTQWLMRDEICHFNHVTWEFESDRRNWEACYSPKRLVAFCALNPSVHSHGTLWD